MFYNCNSSEIKIGIRTKIYILALIASTLSCQAYSTIIHPPLLPSQHINTLLYRQHPTPTSTQPHRYSTRQPKTTTQTITTIPPLFASSLTPTSTLAITPNPISIERGNKITISVITYPGASCYLDYYTPSQNPSTAKGQSITTTADSNGICTWIWQISGNTDPGVGHIYITIDDQTHQFDIIIQP